MKFEETRIVGAYLIDRTHIVDERGYFARAFCRSEFEEMGLDVHIEQSNVGFSHKAGTLRGMHYQRDEAAEVKVVNCTQGAVFDVAVDLRPDSASYGQWFGTELSAANGQSLYIPEGCAHGYLTLADDTMLIYTTNKTYAPDLATGIPWDDPSIAVEWPTEPSVISDADRGWPGFQRS